MSEEIIMKMTKLQSEWATQAEMCMMGLLVPVSSQEQVEFITEYIICTVNTEDLSIKYLKEAPRGKEVFENIHRYNSEKTPVSHITVSSSPYGTLITYARDSDFQGPYTKTLEKGGTCDALCYVYNIQYPDLSELGYCFFQAHPSNSKMLRRVS